MLWLDIQADRILRAESNERPIALTGFAHKVFAAADLRVRAEHRNVRADTIARGTIATREHVCDHRGRRRLAVRARNGDVVAVVHQRAE